MKSPHTPDTFAAPLTHSRRVLVGAVLAFAIFTASLTALAFASSSLVSIAHNGKFNESILVNAKGRTLYVLNGESTHHVLCKSSACFSLWPPLTVSSRSTKLTDSGVHGSLGLLQRGHDDFQVTLNGQPLYTYAGDSSRGQANGEDIVSFGGAWHTVLSSGRVR